MLVKIFDAAVAVAGLILFIVTYPIIAIAIKLDSRGPGDLLAEAHRAQRPALHLL